MNAMSATLMKSLAFAALAVGSASATANLLVNGSFENGAFVNQGNDTMSPAVGSTVITGWTVVTDATAWIGPTNPFGLTASEGSYFLDMTNYQAGPPFAGVTQTVATTPGASYVLSFDLGGSTFWGRPDSLLASAGGTSATFTTGPASTATPNNDWYHETMAFVATSASTVITLQGSAGAKYIGLDNVSVVPTASVPEPGRWALMLAGLVLAGAVSRRRGASRQRTRP